MAQVRLSDVIIPEVYASYGEVNSPELTAFLASGIVERNAFLDAHVDGPSKTGHMPFWNDLDQTIEPNYTNDDPADGVTPNKLTTGEMAYRKTYMHQSWQTMDFVKQLLGASPMMQIKQRTSTYWLRRLQRKMIAIAKGVLAKNIATNSSDMLISVANEAGNTATAAEKFNLDAVMRAAFTMGDRFTGFTTIACHSMIALQMARNDDLTVERDSTGEILVRTYKGMNVIVDDSMPVAAGATNGFKYTSVLFGKGMFGMGVGTPDVPFELARDPNVGNGGGMETWHERKNWLIHPIGHNWVEGTLVEQSPTDADLALAAHWTRIYSRKLIPMAFLITN